MTRKEIYAELQAWERVQIDIDRQSIVLAVIGLQHVWPFDALPSIAKAHTDAVARIVGDTTGALKWWKEQCKYGANPLSAGKGNKIRPIKTLKQLAGLICEP